MRRGWKILIGVVVVLVVLLGLNALSVDHETKAAGVTEPGEGSSTSPAATSRWSNEGPRSGEPIVLIHCFTCAINYWDGMIPLLATHAPGDRRSTCSATAARKSPPRATRSQARPTSSPKRWASSACATPRSSATRSAAPSRSPLPSNRRSSSTGSSSSTASRTPLRRRRLHRRTAASSPVIGEALWRIKPDFVDQATASRSPSRPASPVPDAFVEDVKRMTYSAYTGSPRRLRRLHRAKSR